MQDIPESGVRASLGGGARPGRDGAHPARRADGGRSLPAAGARGLRRVLWVSDLRAKFESSFSSSGAGRVPSGASIYGKAEKYVG